MPVPCYGCGQTVGVDRRWPEQGLLLAGWVVAGGETYCPACAQARGLATPSGAATPVAQPVRRSTAPEPPAGIAIADPATSRAARQYLRAALAGAVVGAVALAAVILIVALRTAQEHQRFASGIHTPGVIVGMPACGCGGQTWVGYTADGVNRHAYEDLPASGAGYYLGESIEVSYDPSDPSRLFSPAGAIPTGWARPLTFAGLFGLVLLVGGMGAARRARRWQVVLAGSEWRAYRLTYVPVWKRSPGLVLKPKDESLPPLMLRLGAVFKWRSLLLRTATGRTVWLGGDPKSHAVLAVHPGPHLFPAEPIRPRNLGRYQAAAAKVRAADALTPAERLTAVEKAHRRAELPILISWGILGLATIWKPTALAWLVLVAQSVVWGAAVVRLRMARDRELDSIEHGGEASDTELGDGEPEDDGAGVAGSSGDAGGLQELVVPAGTAGRQLDRLPAGGDA